MLNGIVTPIKPSESEAGMNPIRQDQSDLIVEADFMWREIQIGDDIYIDADHYMDGERKLCKAVPYQVLNKVEALGGAQTLVVQSYKTGELVNVSMYQVCSYEQAPTPIQMV